MGAKKWGWTPSLWASWRPFGIGLQRPNNYKEILRALWENRDQLPFAWRILSRGVCDGCALGTHGLRDWTLDGVHLCNIRLRLLRLNTMPPVDGRALLDVDALRAKTGAELRALGRLDVPRLRRRGERGFSPVTWDEAMALLAERIRAVEAKRMGFYVTSRGMPNEAYYMAQKAARALGCNNIDNAARVCHAPSTSALKSAIGAAASTCSYLDWLDAELIVFIGSNVANNQPVATKYLHYAKKNGARVLLVNAFREPGMERYWIPSVLESALFGTKLADRVFLIHTGSDTAFLNGVFKHMVEQGWVDRAFIDASTVGYEQAEAVVKALSWEALEHACGASRAEMKELALSLGNARRVVFVWSMGVTQHRCGVENVRAIINLALVKGFIGRAGCGLMPIRGHSGVQGGAEMGCYATAFPGGLEVNAENARRLGAAWGFAVPDTPGMTAPEMIDAAHEGMLELLFSVGGNFLEVLPDPERAADALRRVPLRVHMDIVVSSQMLVDPACEVLLLPAATRYETPGGVTQTSTERRVIFSPEIPGRRVGAARPEWEVFQELVRMARPELENMFCLPGTQAVREEIARIIPQYDGIQHLKAAGESFQYGGRHLCANGHFPTPDGRARFFVPTPAVEAPGRGWFRLSTRRGKQYNSMVQESRDAITGAAREDVLISEHDARALGLQTGDWVLVRSEHGSMRARINIAPIRPGNVQVHWPEGNILLDGQQRALLSGVLDYNAMVQLEPIRGGRHETEDAKGFDPSATRAERSEEV